MNVFKKILSVYSFILTFSLLQQGVRNLKSAPDVVLLALVIFPALYFVLTLIVKRDTKTIRYLSLISTLLLFLIVLIGLTLRFEVLFIVLLCPLPLYFVLISTPDQKKTEHLIIKQPVVSQTEPLATPQQVEIPKKVSSALIGDPFRRQFIKAIGGAGIGLLLTAILNPQKAEASFFGSIPGPGTVSIKDTAGAKIDPAIKSPTDAYGISQIDSAAPSYYGFQNKDGAWYITKEESDGSFRYAKGDTNFSTNWTNRAALPYDYFSLTF